MTESASSKFLLPFLLCIHFLIYADRGVIPGSIEQLNRFIVDVSGTSVPDMLIGLLQSIFVVGLAVSCPIVGSLSHRYSAWSLIAVGLIIWGSGVLTSGVGGRLKIYSLLLAGRALSGTGEAALISLTPPIVMKQAKPRFVGIWIGVFCSMIPIGTAAGFCYGSFLSASWVGWSGAFFLEAFVVIPFVIVLCYLALTPGAAPFPIGTDFETVEAVVSSTSHLDQVPAEASSPICSHSAPVQTVDRERTSSFYDHFRIVLASPPFVWIAMSYAAYAATVSTMSTFGAAFLTDLEFVDNTVTASMIMGIGIAVTGAVGSLLGGGVASAVTGHTDKPWSMMQPHEELDAADSSDGVRALVPLRCSSARNPFDWELPSQPSLPPDPLKGWNGMISTATDSQCSEGSYHAGWRERETFERPVDNPSGNVTSALIRQPLSSPYNGAYDTELSPKQLFQLTRLASALLPLLLVGSAMLMMACLTSGRWTFIFLMGMGFLSLFATQAGLYMASMLSVPECHRTCAVATATLCLHVFGDVPAPVLIGLLKDFLAPHCRVKEPSDIVSVSSRLLGAQASSGSDFSSVRFSRERFLSQVFVSELCRNESAGVRVTMLASVGFLIWMVVGLLQARSVALGMQARTSIGGPCERDMGTGGAQRDTT